MAGLFAVFWTARIDNFPICCDAYDNLNMGLSLARSGTMSLIAEPPYSPTMYREPVPAFVNAAILRVAEAFGGAAPLEVYANGERASWLKYQNVLWLALLFAAAYAVTFSQSGSRALAIAAALLAQGIFLYPGAAYIGVNSLFTEILSMAVMISASVLYAAGVRDRGALQMLAVGALFGLLALIKAVMLPVFAVLLAITPLVMWWGRIRISLRAVAALGIGFALIVAPWMARNYAQFGTLKIADRGGYSLMTRAIHNEGVWPEQYAGAFYAWTLSPLKPFVGALSGHTELDMQAGGPLEAFNWFDHSGFVEEDRIAMFAGRPQDARSYYYKGRAEWERRREEFRQAGAAHPSIAADGALTRDALRMMAADPVAHLAMILPSLWRGAPFTFPILALILWVALRAREAWTLAFILPSLGLILFYAGFANFEERYGFPAIAVTLVVACLYGQRLYHSTRRTLERSLATQREDSSARAG